jgi:cytochrome o ubiquinol oxidase subunit 2
VQQVKTDGTALNTDAYLKLEKPSEREPVRHYASYQDALYSKILNMCATPGKMCTDDMMMIDMKGGAGKESQENREKLMQNGAPIDEFGTPNQADYFGPEASVKSEAAPKVATSDDNSMPGMDMSGSKPASSSNGN